MGEVFKGKLGVPELVLRQQRHALPADLDTEGFVFPYFQVAEFLGSFPPDAVVFDDAAEAVGEGIEADV